MRISVGVPLSREPFPAIAERVRALEAAGADVVLVAESYSFDAVSRVGYLAAVTERITIGTGIVNVYSRTPTAIAQTAAGCDYVSGGRFVLGLGTSGPQVIEGFHGVPYEAPRSRTIDCIEVTRKLLRRELLTHDGPTVTIPTTEGTGLGRPLKLIETPVRPRVPIWWASMLDRSVQSTAEVADGWLPLMFVPEAAQDVWGAAVKAGTAKRDPALGPLEIVAGGKLAIDPEQPAQDLLDAARPPLALYVGGMGARGRNFYNDIVARAGYEDAARTIQDLYLDGHKDEAAAAIPPELLQRMHLIGSAAEVAERIAAYRAAGVTTLHVEPVGPDPAGQVARLRELL